jgi:hypothetical protein
MKQFIQGAQKGVADLVWDLEKKKLDEKKKSKTIKACKDIISKLVDKS